MAIFSKNLLTLPLRNRLFYCYIDFEGGLYAAAISVDGDDDINGRVYEGIKN